MKSIFFKTIRRRVINKIYTVILTKISEKKFKFKNIDLKYIIFKSNQKYQPLIVSFPACWSGGAKYNYIGTLKGFKCNKLFLLDDAAENKRGNYLIGNGYIDAVITLINSTIKTTQPSKIIFIGSSKGGYTALFYSFFIKNVYVCIGAPQYHLGTYLNKMEDKCNLQSIIGSITEEKIEHLDNYLKSIIFQSPIKPNVVYLQYSNIEHTYEEHIKDMIIDLKEQKIKLIEEIKSYPEHGDVVFYFPTFLKNTLNTIIESKK